MVSVKKRLIFTLTSGRSGTTLMTRMLRRLRGVEARHEPHPDFASVMRQAINNPELAKEFWLNQKLPSIEQVDCRVYVEASHLFCKGFVEPLLSIGIIPDAIVLSRDKRATATSLYQLGTVPERTEKGLKYCLSPSDTGVVAPVRWQEMHDYQLCYWYCLEIARRQALYAKMICSAGGRILYLRTEELLRRRGIIDLTRFCVDGVGGAVHWANWAVTRGIRVNSKQSQKSLATMPPVDAISRMEHEVERAMQWNDRE